MPCGRAAVRILLVEDDPGLGAALRDHVVSEGHTVDWVEMLADARACIVTVAYDLVLLDLSCRTVEDFDFLRSIRASKHTVPLIILTARDRLTDRIEGLNAGADDYLVKPFDLSELSARIGSVSRRYAGNPNPHIAFGALRGRSRRPNGGRAGGGRQAQPARVGDLRGAAAQPRASF